MTKQEVGKLLMMIQATYPNFKMEDKQSMLNAWHMFLEEYDPNMVLGAFKAYVKGNTTGFAPSINQILNILNKPAELNELSDAKAWEMVLKAIGRGNYYWKDDFNKFPKEVQDAVGSAEQIRIWAGDPQFNYEVVQGLFQKNYRNILARKRDFNALPPELQLQVKNQYQIGVNNELQTT